MDFSSWPHFLHVAYPEKPMIYWCCLSIQWSVSHPVTNILCFLSKASRPLGSLCEDFSVNSFSHVISTAAAQCSECLFLLTLATHGEIEVGGLGLRKGLFDHAPPKASGSILLWIPMGARTQRSITLFWKDRTHISCQHSRTSCDVTLDILRACKTAWLPEHV
jgi:hypothetical protein